MDKLRRVVITGIGAVTPLANNAQETWKKLCVGKSGIGRITIFDAETFPTKIAGEVKNFKLSSRFAANSEYEFLGRNSRFALEATREAFEDAALDKTSMDASRLGLYFGAGDGGFNFSEYASIVVEAMDNEEQSLNVSRYLKLSAEKISSKELREQEPSQVIHHLSKAFGVKGSVSNCLTACAASSQAIGEAFELIRHGHNDVMITGGTHSMIHPLGVAGFNLLTALSVNNENPQGASRPFDKNRDGFVLAEGAAVLIIEELEHAKKRGAKIYAEIAGYGGTADAYRMTDPHEKGRGAIKAMQLALESAKLNPKDIDYINAHGTSTQLNDQIETLSVKQVFGEHAKNIPMSSIKSMLGHMIAAAGAVELIASALAIVDGIIPPTMNYETPDSDCDLDVVPNVARKKELKNVLSNSFGFGGQNISLIVKKYE